MSDEQHEAPELKLSPSEQRGHNIAMRMAGAGRREKSTKKALCAIALGFQLFVIFLGGLALYGMKVFNPQWLGLVAGGALCLLTIVALATIRFGRLGFALGWVVQVAFFASGALLPGILIPAVFFGALWVYSLYKGAQIDRLRKEHEAGLLDQPE